MKNLFRIIVLAVFTFGASATMSAQESYGNALNLFASFDGDTASLNGHFEIDLAKNLTLSPEGTLALDFDYAVIGARLDYYLDEIVQLNEPWDLWVGAGAGLKVGSEVSNDINVTFHVGGEYKFTQTFGVILEGGNGGASVGLGIHL